MFINIVQSFSYLWRINKYQRKIRYEFKSYFFNNNHFEMSWNCSVCELIFLQLCLTKHFSNEREIGEIPCSRFLSQSKLLRWRQMLRTVFLRKQLMQLGARYISTGLPAHHLNRNHSRHIVYSKLLMKEIEMNCRTQIWQLTYLFQEKCRGTIKFDSPE